MSESNKSKAQRGYDNQSVLEGIFEELKAGGYIKSFISPYRFGYADYKDDQFYAPFFLTFDNGEKWIVYTTTSFRSDRVKEYLWDIINLKNLNSDITKAYLVYPENLSKEDEKPFRELGRKVASHEIFSNLDGVYSTPAFIAKCKAQKNSDYGDGYMHSMRGTVYEHKLSNALKNKANLRELKRHDESNITGDEYLLEQVLKVMEQDPFDVEKIESSADRQDIGLLPSHGQPKTDVIADLVLETGERKTVTISCKRTDSDWVSIAQYSADKIADAVDRTNFKLRELLNKFQEEGTIGSMTADEQRELAEELKPIMKRFCMWAFGGIGGEGNPKTQWANWIAVFKDDEDLDDFDFYSIEDYVAKQIKEVKGNFGTPFHWTYASGAKGKSIQLKAKVI